MCRGALLDPAPYATRPTPRARAPRPAPRAPRPAPRAPSAWPWRPSGVRLGAPSGRILRPSGARLAPLRGAQGGTMYPLSPLFLRPWQLSVASSVASRYARERDQKTLRGLYLRTLLLGGLARSTAGDTGIFHNAGRESSIFHYNIFSLP